SLSLCEQSEARANNTNVPRLSEDNDKGQFAKIAAR
ncbi:MAG: hypothetical protein QG673_2214, partial [Pseudomonadota bacterium]|nr:hypothetical protein [Pseudomonadota bacterium]